MVGSQKTNILSSKSSKAFYYRLVFSIKFSKLGSRNGDYINWWFQPYPIFGMYAGSRFFSIFGKDI